MHRVLLFEGHWYAIYSYGFFLVLAMLMGMWITTARARRASLPPDTALDFILAVLVGGLIGARLVVVLEDWTYYSQALLQIVNIRGGGLSWHGGVLGGLLGFLWYTRRTGLGRGMLLDLATPGLIAAHVVGRIGCFLNGCCYGRETGVPWAATFPDAPELHFLPRHPTQIYEACGELVLLGVVLLFERRRPAPGALFYLYACMYAVERFIIEFFRAEPILPGGLSLAQYASFVILIAAGIALWRTWPPAADTAPATP